MLLCLGVDFETDKVLCTYFARYDMNDVTIPHANIVSYVISFREGWYGFRKPQCGDPEHRITLCEIYSIKTENIDGYMINNNIRALSIKPAKPVSPALPVLPLVEKRCRRGDVNRKHSSGFFFSLGTHHLAFFRRTLATKKIYCF